MSTHTPGPWKYIGDAEIAGPDGRMVAYAAVCRMTDEDLRNRGPASANARLIAAAPELLAALQETREYLDGFIDVVDGPNGQPLPNRAMSLCQEIDEAIAKATPA